MSLERSSIHFNLGWDPLPLFNFLFVKFLIFFKLAILSVLAPRASSDFAGLSMLSSLAITHGVFSTPATDAAAMLAKMSLVEKVTLLHGKGGTLGARCPHLTLSNCQ